MLASAFHHDIVTLTLLVAIKSNTYVSAIVVHLELDKKALTHVNTRHNTRWKCHKEQNSKWAIYTDGYKCIICFDIALKVIVCPVFDSQWMFFARYLLYFSALVSKRCTEMEETRSVKCRVWVPLYRHYACGKISDDRFQEEHRTYNNLCHPLQHTILYSYI